MIDNFSKAESPLPCNLMIDNFSKAESPLPCNLMIDNFYKAESPLPCNLMIDNFSKAESPLPCNLMIDTFYKAPLFKLNSLHWTNNLTNTTFTITYIPTNGTLSNPALLCWYSTLVVTAFLTSYQCWMLFTEPSRNFVFDVLSALNAESSLNTVQIWLSEA